MYFLTVGMTGYHRFSSFFIGHKGPYGEYRYSSTLSKTSVLDWVGGSAPRPGR